MPGLAVRFKWGHAGIDIQIEEHSMASTNIAKIGLAAAFTGLLPATSANARAASSTAQLQSIAARPPQPWDPYHQRFRHNSFNKERDGF
jgi:hypothetical protein